MAANYAYLRVSTDEQDVRNQKHGVLEYANAHGFTGLVFVEDSVSGSKPWTERKLGELVEETMKKGDVLLVSEVSRLARSTRQVLDVLEVGAKKGLSIHIVKQNLIFDGKNNMTAKIMATVLGMVAEIEREFVSQRTIEALAVRKAAGIKLGRPKGKANTVKLDAKEKVILGYLAKGINKRSIALLLDCAPSTLYAWLERKGLHDKGAKKKSA